MVRTLAPALCALAALALGACSQQNADFMPSGGGTGGAPGTGSASSAAPTAPAAALPATARRATSWIGMPVRSHSGAALGAVLDIVFATTGEPTHLIVVHAGGAAPGALTAIPWALAIQHLQAGTLVMKSERFAAAPTFPPDAWPSLEGSDWSAAADAYWARTSAPPPSVPVDPTTRSRERPAMTL